MGFFEIKNFCPLNDIVKEMKRKTTDWKKLFAKCTADGRLISRTSPPQIKYGQMICTEYLHKTYMHSSVEAKSKIYIGPLAGGPDMFKI